MLIYYLFYMPIILQLLNSASFSRYSSIGFTIKPRCTAPLVVLLFKLFFIIVYYDDLVEYYRKTSLLTLVIIWCTFYVHFLIITLPLALAHYIQLGTMQTMKAISEQNVCKQDICKQVKEVAHLNSRLHFYNSAPLLFFLISNTCDSLTAIFRISEVTIFQHSPMAYSTGLFVYQLYLAYLSHQTVEILRKIVESKRAATKAVSNMFFHISYQNRIDLQNLLFFKDQLSLKIYSLINFNFTFVLKLGLFLVQYSVLLLQTKTEN